MKTIQDVFTAYKNALQTLYKSQEITALTALVIIDITKFSRAQIAAFPEKEITVSQSEEFEKVLERMQTGEPVQYILGHTEFYGLPFKVDPSVLIPRPETEELVEWILSTVRGSELAVSSILDIGTGSGCIAISLKKNLQSANISAIDISTKALNIADQNAELNDVKVDFIETDILNTNPEIKISKSDIIVSNPPYVTEYDKTLMHTNVVDFEPHTALFVPESDPLIFYRAIADFALKNLANNGLLFFEINESLGYETVELLKDKGFKNIELREDMSGRDRMIKADR